MTKPPPPPDADHAGDSEVLPLSLLILGVGFWFFPGRRRRGLQDLESSVSGEDALNSLDLVSEVGTNQNPKQSRIPVSRGLSRPDAQAISANARFIALAVAATAASAGRDRTVALKGSARTGPS